MPKIRFLSRQEPRTGREVDPVYEEGQVYNLREDQCRRWLNRGVAERMPDKAKAAEPKTTDPKPEPEAAPAPRMVGGERSAPDAMTSADIKPADGYDDMTREELIAAAEERGVELPSGYLAKPRLVEILRGAGS